MRKTYIIALSFLLISIIGIAINDYAKQYNLIVAEGSTPNPGHPIDQIDGLQSIIDDINDTISGLGVIGEGGSGDVNDDGEIDIVDSLFIASYLEGILETFTPEQKLAADYDGDGVITYYDADAIANVSAGHSKEEAIRMAYSTVGIQDKGSFYKIDHNTNIGGNLYVSGGIHVEGGSGDVKDDGEITSTDSLFILQYLDGTRTFTPEQKLAADYDGDGVITYYDARAILATVVGSSKEEAIRIAYSNVGIQEDGSYKINHNTNIGGDLYVSGGIRAEGGSGDVFIDGVINVNDSLYILHYLKGNLEFTSEQKSAADYNGDGVITHYDAIAILFTIAGYNKEESIKKAQKGVFVPESDEDCDDMVMQGYIRYNASTKKMEYCNGSVWTNL